MKDTCSQSQPRLLQAEARAASAVRISQEQESGVGGKGQGTPGLWPSETSPLHGERRAAQEPRPPPAPPATNECVSKAQPSGRWKACLSAHSLPAHSRRSRRRDRQSSNRGERRGSGPPCCPRGWCPRYQQLLLRSPSGLCSGTHVPWDQLQQPKWPESEARWKPVPLPSFLVGTGQARPDEGGMWVQGVALTQPAAAQCSRGAQKSLPPPLPELRLRSRPRLGPDPPSPERAPRCVLRARAELPGLPRGHSPPCSPDGYCEGHTRWTEKPLCQL